VDSALSRVAEHEQAAPILAKLDAINRHFSFDAVGEILASLEAAGPDDAFAAETLAGMRVKSPMSMAIAIEQVKRGRVLDFNDAMVMEYRIVSRLVHDPDFYEGVRALIIDKDNHPRWNPARIEDVDPAKVAAHFEPLPRDLDLPGA
jgi:enoyl-CoA hydratase